MRDDAMPSLDDVRAAIAHERLVAWDDEAVTAQLKDLRAQLDASADAPPDQQLAAAEAVAEALDRLRSAKGQAQGQAAAPTPRPAPAGDRPVDARTLLARPVSGLNSDRRRVALDLLEAVYNPNAYLDSWHPADLLAELALWRSAASDPTLGRPVRRAAAQVGRACEQLLSARSTN